MKDIKHVRLVESALLSVSELKRNIEQIFALDINVINVINVNYCVKILMNCEL